MMSGAGTSSMSEWFMDIRPAGATQQFDGTVLDSLITLTTFWGADHSVTLRT